jgi:hypothetical protein
MRLVALTALRDLAVLFFMTGSAGKLAVFGGTVAQNLEDLIMTSAAVCGRDIRSEGDNQRLVRLVTLVTVSLDHGRAMRFVAIAAFGDIAMCVFVTGRTGEGRVLARELL